MREADLSSFNDHRVLMALAVAACRATGESRLTYPNAHRISFPQFLDQMNSVGLHMSVDRARARRLPRPAAEPAGRQRHEIAPATRPAPARPAGPPSPVRSAGTSSSVRSAAVPAPARLAATPVAELVRRHAGAHPDDEAVIEAASPGRSGTTLSWGELDRRADQAASLLLELGVGPGEVVAWQLPNWAEFVVLTLATTRIGAVCCPLMPFFREREMGRLLHRSRARVLVIPDRFRSRAHLAETASVLSGPDAPAVAHVLVVRATDEPPAGPAGPPSDALALPSSGAAGRPGDAARSGDAALSGDAASAGDGGLPADTAAVRWQWFGEALDRQRPDGPVLAARRPAPGRSPS